jgi:predicted site-specific integrase-resolvase
MVYSKVKTTAEQYGICEKTAIAWIKKGLITASKPETGPTLINVQSVSDYLPACTLKDTRTDTIVKNILSEMSMN